MKMLRAIGVSRVSVDDLLQRQATFSELEARVYALERQATLCDALVGWPALAESFRRDAKRLRDRCAELEEI